VSQLDEKPGSSRDARRIDESLRWRNLTQCAESTPKPSLCHLLVLMPGFNEGIRPFNEPAWGEMQDSTTLNFRRKLCRECPESRLSQFGTRNPQQQWPLRAERPLLS